MKVSKDQHLKAERKCLTAAAAEWSVTRDQTPGAIWGYRTSTFFLKIFANMYRERKTWSSRKFGESTFSFGEDDVFQMKEFRTTITYIIYIYIYRMLYRYGYTHQLGTRFSRNPSSRAWINHQMWGWEEILEVTIGIAPLRPVGMGHSRKIIATENTTLWPPI